jgi:hypothetical protein
MKHCREGLAGSDINLIVTLYGAETTEDLLCNLQDISSQAL